MSPRLVIFLFLKYIDFLFLFFSSKIYGVICVWILIARELRAESRTSFHLFCTQNLSFFCSSIALKNGRIFCLVTFCIETIKAVAFSRSFVMLYIYIYIYCFSFQQFNDAHKLGVFECCCLRHRTTCCNCKMLAFFFFLCQVVILYLNNHLVKLFFLIDYLLCVSTTKIFLFFSFFFG